MSLPSVIESADQLDEILTRPTERLVREIRQIRSPMVVLGASGKMGPSLCVLARRAAEQAGHPLRVIAVSRFSDPASREWLESRGIETMSCDLLDRSTLGTLPETENLIYLVGLKFGTRQSPWMTWAVNTLVPAHVAERYPKAQIAALSTGNVYPYTPVNGGGATENVPPSPLGEYGSAALARERIFEYYARLQGTAVVTLRLNYAVELRYGVLLDVAQKVWSSSPVEVNMGHLNCIWQGDANEMIIRSLRLAATPPTVYNLTGQATLSVRDLAIQFGKLMGRQPSIVGNEAPTALLSNATQLIAHLGEPAMPLQQLLDWTAAWVRRGGTTLGKPTHFEVRTGDF